MHEEDEQEQLHSPSNLYKYKTGDLVYIIDPNNKEPIKMGIGLVVGETKINMESHNTWSPSTPVLWEGCVQYLDEPYWMLQVISAC